MSGYRACIMERKINLFPLFYEQRQWSTTIEVVVHRCGQSTVRALKSGSHKDKEARPRSERLFRGICRKFEALNGYCHRASCGREPSARVGRSGSVMGSCEEKRHGKKAAERMRTRLEFGRGFASWRGDARCLVYGALCVGEKTKSRRGLGLVRMMRQQSRPSPFSKVLRAKAGMGSGRRKLAAGSREAMAHWPCNLKAPWLLFTSINWVLAPKLYIRQEMRYRRGVGCTRRASRIRCLPLDIT